MLTRCNNEIMKFTHFSTPSCRSAYRNNLIYFKRICLHIEKYYLQYVIHIKFRCSVVFDKSAVLFVYFLCNTKIIYAHSRV